jgi:hypothetical protein
LLRGVAAEAAAAARSDQDGGDSHNRMQCAGDADASIHVVRWTEFTTHLRVAGNGLQNGARGASLPK